MSLLNITAGVLGGVLHDCVQYFKDKKEKDNEQKRIIELETLKSNLRIKEYEAGIVIEKEKTEQANFNFQQEEQRTNGIKAQSEASIGIEQEKTEQNRYDNIAKATQYISGNGKWAEFGNCVIAITRPLLTILLLLFQFLFVGAICFKLTTQQLGIFLTNENSTLSSIALNMQFLLEIVFGFWFYKRSSEKMSLQKKNS